MNNDWHSLEKSLLNSDNELILDSFELIPYKIKLTTPLHSATSSLYFREGLLIKLDTNKACCAIGECAPMTSIGTESLLQAQQFLQHKLPTLTGKPLNSAILSDMNSFPACRFALESALLSLLAQQNNTSIALLLNKELDKAHIPAIKVNTMLGALDDNTIARVKQAESEGFHCIKIKLGINPLDLEAQQLKELLRQSSAASSIRLDANKSWTLEQTKWLLDFLQPVAAKIDCLEEPLAHFNKAEYQALQKHTEINLALDESFARNAALHNFPVRRLVIKPMAQGGLTHSLILVRQAQQQNIETIITSSIESGYGLWAISQLCAAVNNQQYHGIATASWLEQSLIKPPEITHGSITL